jgi:hypothetical protein
LVNLADELQIKQTKKGAAQSGAEVVALPLFNGGAYQR